MSWKHVVLRLGLALVACGFVIGMAAVTQECGIVTECRKYPDAVTRQECLKQVRGTGKE